MELTEKFQPGAVKDGRIEFGELEDDVVTRLTYIYSGVIEQTDAAHPRNTEEPENKGKEEERDKKEEAPRSKLRRIIPRPPQEHWMKEEAARVSAIVEQRGADAKAKLEALAEMEKEIAKAKAAVLADAKAEDNAAPMETTDDGLGSD